MEKKFINYREYIIAFAIAITMIIVGSFTDLNFLKAVHDAENINWFGIILSGLAEIPTYLAIGVAGTLLIVSSQGGKKWQKILLFILGIIATAYSLFYIGHTFSNIAKFERTLDAKKTITICGYILSLILVSVSDLLIVRFTYKKDRNVLRNVGIMIAFLVVIELLLATGIKYIFSRPRPSYIFGEYGVENDFKNWWQFSPFECFKLSKSTGLNKNNWLSCPSGHSCTAIVLAFILPYLTLLDDDWKNNKTVRAIAFYIGLAWGIMSAISRVYAGVHFLSDVGMGVLLGIICGLFTQLIIPYIIKLVDKIWSLGK